MTTITQTGASTVRPEQPRPAGTLVERHGWVLTGLVALTMVVGGSQALLLGGDGPTAPIGDSGCCTGRTFVGLPGWVYTYVAEQGRFLGTHLIGLGVLSLVLVVTGLRQARRSAWAALWVLPAMFAIEAYVLGARFEQVTAAVSAAGLLLMVRPVLGRSR